MLQTWQIDAVKCYRSGSSLNTYLRLLEQWLHILYIIVWVLLYPCWNLLLLLVEYYVDQESINIKLNTDFPIYHYARSCCCFDMSTLFREKEAFMQSLGCMRFEYSKTSSSVVELYYYYVWNHVYNFMSFQYYLIVSKCGICTEGMFELFLTHHALSKDAFCMPKYNQCDVIVRLLFKEKQ